MAVAYKPYADRFTRRPITDIFTADTDFDRRPVKRNVPMKVLILGLGRTGTACKSAEPLTLARRADC